MASTIRNDQFVTQVPWRDGLHHFSSQTYCKETNFQKTADEIADGSIGNATEMYKTGLQNALSVEETIFLVPIEL